MNKAAGKAKSALANRVGSVGAGGSEGGENGLGNGVDGDGDGDGSAGQEHGTGGGGAGGGGAGGGGAGVATALVLGDPGMAEVFERLQTADSPTTGEPSAGSAAADSGAGPWTGDTRGPDVPLGDEARGHGRPGGAARERASRWAMRREPPMSETTPTRYRFGPLERRGLVAGWRGGQIGAVAVVLVIGVGVLRASPSPVGVVLAVVALALGVGVATWPISGRTAEEWAPDALRHVTARGRPSRDRTSPFAGVHLVEVDPSAEGSGIRLGVLHDRSRRTFTAVLRASDPGFVLLGEEDKAQRVSAWSGVLASMARDGSAVHRLQWVERVVPGDNTSAALRPDTAGQGPGYDAAVASYEALLVAEADAPMHHGAPGGHCPRGARPRREGGGRR